MHEILSFQDIPEMNIKWGFVDLYWALSRLNEAFKIKDHEEAFGNFYAKFEQERRAVGDDPTTLLSTGSEWDQDLYYYLDPFQREGAKRDNIKKRHEIYIRRIHFDIPELALLDEKRFFTRDERIAIWRRDDQVCKSCHKKITFEEMEADHIFAWSKGGSTSLSNAQSLCSDCNKSKGNSS